MTAEITVALISLAGSGIGAFIGIVVNSKLTNYRLEQLEKKVDRHNNFGERIPVLQEQIKMQNRRIAELESGEK